MPMGKNSASREASLEQIENATLVVEGAIWFAMNMEIAFLQTFSFITGFHGFHVLSGVVINIITFLTS